MPSRPFYSFSWRGDSGPSQVLIYVQPVPLGAAATAARDWLRVIVPTLGDGDWHDHARLIAKETGWSVISVLERPGARGGPDTVTIGFLAGRRF